MPSHDDTEDVKYTDYWFILDGEVVWKHSIANNYAFEMMHAIFSSKPIVVKAPDEINLDITYGWKYDGENFSPPVE